MSERLATISVKGVRHSVYARLVDGKPILYTTIYFHGASKEIHAESLDELEDKARDFVRKMDVKIEIPFTRFIMINGEWTTRRGVVIGFYKDTVDLLIRYYDDNGKLGRAFTDNLGYKPIFTKLSSEIEQRIIEAKQKIIDSEKEFNEICKTYAIYPVNRIREIYKKHVAKMEQEEKSNDSK